MVLLVYRGLDHWWYVRTYLGNIYFGRFKTVFEAVDCANKEKGHLA